ncbi:DUF6578 domain-containing protein [Tsukamurella pseudospumae]|uniref:Uncharacterized protein n=1 Tax=Tsukamurella pseudospumae TaxID=239498 RepID=A0A137ZD82_9ACTN|nr:DUF6578 domain-containing protein [Tsukamurella pseudospumae]KXO96163.1 hypothetical protein AXK61_23330 [Tsukamurella pseudospumae]
MNTPSPSGDSLLYVHIDNWEYQCCGTVPRVGAELSGTLTVYESESPGYRAPAVTGFDPRTGLVRFGSIVAQLGSGLSEPAGDTALVLSWHDHTAKPRLTGVVEQVIEETGRFLPIGADRTLRVDPESREFHEVAEATRWPEEQLESGGAATIGVVVGLRVIDLRVPTDAEIEDRLASEDRARRTVRFIAPASMFPADPPATGDRLEIDLSDERIRPPGQRSEAPLVCGEITSVHPLPAIPESAGWVTVTPIIIDEIANYSIDLITDPTE